ncbi:hypothetical protein PVAG01_08979 [Phlyctema vagabunda]|uniref:Uncharacterized protein n=1 Tax=Phlyctema vagabunda TaxID=108571 RepID=A0ABR4PB04_9HELO
MASVEGIRVKHPKVPTSRGSSQRPCTQKRSISYPNGDGTVTDLSACLNGARKEKFQKTAYYTKRDARKQINCLKDQCCSLLHYGCGLNSSELDNALWSIVMAFRRRCQQLRDLVQQQEQGSRNSSRYTSQAFDLFKGIASSIINCRSILMRDALIHDRDTVSSILEALTLLARGLSPGKRGVCLTSTDQWFEQFLIALPQVYISQLGDLAETLEVVRSREEAVRVPMRRSTANRYKRPPKTPSGSNMYSWIPSRKGICDTSNENGPYRDELSDDGSDYLEHQLSFDLDARLQRNYLPVVEEAAIDDEPDDNDIEYDDGEQGYSDAELGDSYGEEYEDSAKQYRNATRSTRSMSSNTFFLSPNGLLTTDLSYGLVQRTQKSKDFIVWQPTEQPSNWTGENEV